MKTSFAKYLIPLLAILFLTSCGELSREVEKKYNEFNKVTESLDSLFTKGNDKIMALDSLINSEGEKLKRIDSLIENSTTKIDSLSNEKMKTIEEIINQ